MSNDNLTIPESLARLGIGFTPVGLLLPESLQVESWETLMQALPRLSDAVRWALGDAINYGETRYGSKYTAAMEATGIKYDSLRNYAWVARKVELSTRVDNLSWTHHRILAELTPAEQVQWLSYAQEQGLSVRQLQSAIDAAEEEEKALAEAAKRRQVPAPTTEALPEPEPEFAPPIGKRPAPEPAPTTRPETRLTFQPLVPRPDPPAPAPPVPSVSVPQPVAPRTELNWRNICRAVYNFTVGPKSVTYIFEVIEVRTDSGFAYDITQNGSPLGRRNSLAGAKQRCEEHMAETLRKAEGK